MCVWLCVFAGGWLICCGRLDAPLRTRRVPADLLRCGTALLSNCGPSTTRRDADKHPDSSYSETFPFYKAVLTVKRTYFHIFHRVRLPEKRSVRSTVGDTERGEMWEPSKWSLFCRLPPLISPCCNKCLSNASVSILFSRAFPISELLER